MAASEGRVTDSGGEKKSGESVGGKAPEIKNKDEIRDKVVTDKAEEVNKLLELQKESLNKSFDSLRERMEKKLILGEKYKKDLEEFLDKTKGEVDKILAGGGSEGDKFSKLGELREKRTEELREKIDKWKEEEGDDEALKNSADKVKDKEARKLAKEVVDGIFRVQERMSRLDGLQEEIKTAKDGYEAKPDRKRKQKLEEKVDKYVGEYNKIGEELNEIMDKAGKLEIKELGYYDLERYQDELRGVINEGQKGLGIGEALQSLSDKMELIRAKSSSGSIVIADSEFKEAGKEIKTAVDRGLISGEEGEVMIKELMKIRETELVKGQLQSGEIDKAIKKAKAEVEARGEVFPRGATTGEVQDLLRRKPELQGLRQEDLSRIAMLEHPDVIRALASIPGPDEEPTIESAELFRKIEADPRVNDEVIEVIKMAGGIKNGDLMSKWENYAGSVESQFRPDRLIKDAKRDIVKVTMERLAKGEGELKVTHEDLEKWVLEQMNRVIAGGEESTGYSARQFMMEVSGVLEKKDLEFKELIEEMAEKKIGFNKDGKTREQWEKDKGGADSFEPVEYQLFDQYNRPVGELTAEQYKSFEQLVKGDHVDRAKDDFRDEISAAIVVHELSNAYERSGSAEEMVRIGAHVDTDKFDWVLNMESVGRRVDGRLKFYEVGIDDETKKRQVMKREDMKMPDEEVKDLHTAEISRGGLEMVIKLPEGGDKVIGADDFKDLLRVGQDGVKVATTDIVDILNQERMAVGALSRRKNIREKFRKETVREAIAFRMGLVDIDGEVQWDKIDELVKMRYGEGASFKLRNKEGKNLKGDSRKVRLKLIMDQVGEKKIIPDPGQSKERGVKVGELETKDGKVDVMTLVGGTRENDHGLDDMFNEYKMMFKLGEGIWHATGLAPGHWSKDHSGECKDWHMKIINFVEYLSMYGIGPAHLREKASVDFPDFITRQKKNIFPELFGDNITKDLKGDDKFYQGELVSLLLSDRDGFVMNRQRMLDIFGLRKEGEIKKMLIEKANDRFGRNKGEMMVNRYWNNIKKIKWEGEEGFEGLVKWVKENYKYGNLKWGRGKTKDDNTWAQRWFKEAQYLFSAEKYRGALMGWLAKPESVNAWLEATTVPGYYGTNDQNRKNTILFNAYHDYFSRRTFWMDTTEVDPHSNITKSKDSDPWDGSRRYGKKIVATGSCLSKEERNIDPFSPSQFEEVVNQLHRAGKLTPRYAHELMGRAAEAGDVKMWIDDKIVDRIPIPGVKQVLKLANGLLFGGDIPEFKIGNLRILRERRFPGILGWVWKIFRKWVTDTWSVRKEIIQGMKSAGAEQAGNIFKE